MARIRLLYLALCSLAGCSDEGRVFNLPIEEAHARLISKDFSEFRSERQCGILIHLEPEEKEKNTIIWYVKSSGIETFSFQVKLISISQNKTSAKLVISKNEEGKEHYSGDLVYRRPAVRQPTRPAIEEQIAAYLEDRSYNPNNVPKEKEKDRVCSVQRGGLESGRIKFRVDDEPGEYEMRPVL